MARITVEDCLTRENNRFSLVLLAAKRTKQILNGSKLLLSDVRNKPVVSALREIAAGKVRFMTEEERRIEEERRQQEAATRSEESSHASPEIPVRDVASSTPVFDDSESAGGDDAASAVTTSNGDSPHN